MSEAEALERVKQQQEDATTRHNVLHAAAVSALDPGHMQGVMYFMLQVASYATTGEFEVP